MNSSTAPEIHALAEADALVKRAKPAVGDRQYYVLPCGAKAPTGVVASGLPLEDARAAADRLNQKIRGLYGRSIFTIELRNPKMRKGVGCTVDDIAMVPFEHPRIELAHGDTVTGESLLVGSVVGLHDGYVDVVCANGETHTLDADKVIWFDHKELDHAAAHASARDGWSRYLEIKQYCWPTGMLHKPSLENYMHRFLKPVVPTDVDE
jgi:hypothetical protein